MDTKRLARLFRERAQLDLQIADVLDGKGAAGSPRKVARSVVPIPEDERPSPQVVGMVQRTLARKGKVIGK